MDHTLSLFHLGYQEIQHPDVHYGRKNADFGQGFYLSDDEEFSKRWARERKGALPCLNRYRLPLEGLKIKHLKKDEEWFRYISGNRAGRADAFADYDIIIGPIANDTIYDTWGILTSGLMEETHALRILMLDPAYEQIVLKTEKAASALQFLSSEIVPANEIAKYRQIVKAEENAFQEKLGALILELV